MDSQRTGAGLFKYSQGDFKIANSEEIKKSNTIILIHGFTANSEYLKLLGDFLEQENFNCIYFNYWSYDGIKKAGDCLISELNYYSSFFQKDNNRLRIVAHSMGGLVARQAIKTSKSFFKKLVMLGTPNNGTLNDKWYIQFLLEYGEYISEEIPHATPSCKSALELTKSDDNSGKTFIDYLNSSWQCPPLDVFPVLTISGGLNWLDFSDNFLKNKLYNFFIQRSLDKAQNDGLVPESSVEIPNRVKSYLHFNRYPNYSDVNHSNLIKSPTVFREIVKWLQE
jgi:pimeloyl-ACP methyl ester carboxylesterase